MAIVVASLLKMLPDSSVYVPLLAAGGEVTTLTGPNGRGIGAGTVPPGNVIVDTNAAVPIFGVKVQLPKFNVPLPVDTATVAVAPEQDSVNPPSVKSVSVRVKPEYVIDVALYVTPTGLRVVVDWNEFSLRPSGSSTRTLLTATELPVQVAVPLEAVAKTGGLASL
jgi:hypothetical protein